MRGARIQFSAGGIREARQVARPLDHSGLHPQAEAKERHALFPGPADRRDLAVHTTVAETAGHHNGIHALQQGLRTVRFDLFGADPVQIQGGVLGDTGVPQRLHHREVGIVELDVFAHQRHLHGRSGVAQVVDQLLPGRHVAVMVHQIEHIQHFAAEPLLLEGQRNGIDAVGIQGGDHRPFLHTTETTDLALHLIADRAIAAAHQHIGLDADGAQLLHRVLGGLGFELAGGADEGQQGDVDVSDVASTHIAAEFPNGFEKGQGFDVAHGAADFGDHHIGVAVGGHPFDAFTDLARDVRDHLHGAAVVITAALLVDHRLVNRARGHAVQP